MRLFIPFNSYPVLRLREGLRKLFHRVNFVNECNQWRQRQPQDTISDIYDGRQWKRLAEEKFFASPSNVAFLLNVDWVNLFKNSTYKIGVVYLVILNLPRQER